MKIEEYQRQLDALCAEHEDARILFEALKTEQNLTISQFSHEIRNPVTMINSYLQLIEKEHPEVISFSFWKEVMEDMKYLRQLLEKLSTYNNSETLNLSRIHTESWLNGIAASTSAAISMKPYLFSWNPQTPLPDINGDPVKLRQALTNLLRNGFEALPEHGEVRMAAKACGTMLQITVWDNGCGISSEYMEDLFHPFITHKKNGTGLGLAITKRIIESHQGQLTVTSELNKGTHFTLLLPAIK